MCSRACSTCCTRARNSTRVCVCAIVRFRIEKERTGLKDGTIWPRMCKSSEKAHARQWLKNGTCRREKRDIYIYTYKERERERWKKNRKKRKYKSGKMKNRKTKVRVKKGTERSEQVSHMQDAGGFTWLESAKYRATRLGDVFITRSYTPQIIREIVCSEGWYCTSSTKLE